VVSGMPTVDMPKLPLLEVMGVLLTASAGNIFLKLRKRCRPVAAGWCVLDVLDGARSSVVEKFSVTRGHSRSLEFTLLIMACVSSY